MTVTEKCELIDSHNRIIDAIQGCHKDIKISLSTSAQLFSGMAIYANLAKQALNIARLANEDGKLLVKVDFNLLLVYNLGSFCD